MLSKFQSRIVTRNARQCGYIYDLVWKKKPKQNRIIMIYNRKALLLNVLAIILFSLFSSLSVLGHQWSSLNMFYKIRIPFLHLRAAEPNGEIWHWYLVSLCCRGNCFTAMPRPPYCQPTQPPDVEFTQNIPNFCKYEDISSLNMFLYGINLYYHYKGKVYRIVLPFQQSSIASPQPPPCTDIEHRHHSDASPRRSDLVRTHSISLQCWTDTGTHRMYTNLLKYSQHFTLTIKYNCVSVSFF